MREAMHGFVLGIAGSSGSGKTTLITAILPLLKAHGLRVNVIKHSHHELDLEPPHKDSARFREAGAAEVMVASRHRFAIMHELRGAPEPTLAEQLARLAPADLTLVEGWRSEAIARIEVYRPALGKPPVHPNDPSFIAVASDVPLDIPLPWLPLHEPQRVARFILDCADRHRTAMLMADSGATAPRPMTGSHKPSSFFMAVADAPHSGVRAGDASRALNSLNVESSI